MYVDNMTYGNLMSTTINMYVDNMTYRNLTRTIILFCRFYKNVIFYPWIFSLLYIDIKYKLIY